MSQRKLPSLKVFAQIEDPFENISYLGKRLRTEKTESRYLEWKQRLPIGKDAEKREKYRFVKTAISFANTNSGFIVLGVDDKGVWIGLPEEKVGELDTAHFSELFTDCISHEFDFKVIRYTYRSKTFLILHVPASLRMPHVTTKIVTNNLPSGKVETLVSKNTVYCRKSAKTDVATPSDYERIIGYRTEFVRDALVRRIETVTIEVPNPAKASTGNTKDSKIRTTKDKTATPFRRTADKAEANAVLTHEEITEGIFDDVNNVIDANRQFSHGANVFVLPKSVYYSIYAKRENVFDDADTYRLLALAGLQNFYAPYLYWFNKLTPVQAARIVRDLSDTVLSKSKNTSLYHLVRLMLLMGETSTDWLDEVMSEAWGRHPQPPNY